MEDKRINEALYIAGLIKKSWFDVLSEDEKNELESWMNRSEENRRLIEQINEQDILAEHLLELEQYDVDAATQRFFSQTGIGANKPYAATITPFSPKKALRWVAAAIVLLLGAGAIWYFSPAREVGIAHVSINNSAKIVPGGNNAILTLSDGSKVVLDSAANGLLSNQGNTKVIKLQDGKLAYTASSAGVTQPIYNTITTPRGGQYQVLLPDGTAVWLNAASSISFPTTFHNNERMVKVSGEVYFEVAARHVNATKVPFIVKITSSSGEDAGEVQVLGTHFNINAYTDEKIVKTTLLEGAVKCIKGNSHRLLKPGEQAGFADGITVKTNIDTDEVIAWKNGTFYFNSNDIETIMRQISRWYNIEVTYKGDISKEAFSGIVSRESSLKQVLKIMEAGGVKFDIQGRKIIVMQ